MLTQQLKNKLNKEVNIGYFGVRLPLDLEIKDLNIEGLAKVDHIFISPSLLRLLTGKIVLNEIKILNPEINWERKLTADSEAVNADVADTDVANAEAVNAEIAHTETTNAATGDSKKGDNPTTNPHRASNRQTLQIIIKKLRVNDGIINFTDRTIPEPGIQITLKEFYFELDNLYLFPKSAITNFQLNAKIPWQAELNEGTIYASGWINPYKKDMQARLAIEDIDGVYLHPYYSEWVDLENSRIEEANLNFTSDIQGQNNDVIAQCRLELTDIKFRPRPSEQPEHNAEKLAHWLLNLFRELNQGRVVLSFPIKTKMDKPEFNFDSIATAVDAIVSQGANSNKVDIEDVALLPGRFVEGVARGATGITKAIIEGTISVGKLFTDVFLDAFKKPEEKLEEKNELKEKREETEEPEVTEEIGAQQKNSLEE